MLSSLRHGFKFLQCGLLGFLILMGMIAFAQQTEYRITDAGEYQYLSDHQLAGMVYDESLGTYYKSITARTFFLETQRKGYIPDSITYIEFVGLAIGDQRALLHLQGFDAQCSSDYLSPECLEYRPTPVAVPRSSKATVIDLSPKCIDKSVAQPLPWTLQLILNPDDVKMVNPSCGELIPGLNQQAQPDSMQRKQTQLKTVKVILGKD